MSLPSASPVIVCCRYTPHHLSVGVASGQTLSHLIIALKAQSNGVIALSVTDDWDLQRVRSAPVPVHLCVQGCRLIKGRAGLSQSAAHEPVSFHVFPLTAATSSLPKRRVRPADQGKPLSCDLKRPWYLMKVQELWHGCTYDNKGEKFCSFWHVLIPDCFFPPCELRLFTLSTVIHCGELATCQPGL